MSAIQVLYDLKWKNADPTSYGLSFIAFLLYICNFLLFIE